MRNRRLCCFQILFAVLGSVVAIPCFANERLLVADPAAALDKTWTHQSFGTATEYKGIFGNA